MLLMVIEIVLGGLCGLGAGVRTLCRSSSRHFLKDPIQSRWYRQTCSLPQGCTAQGRLQYLWRVFTVKGEGQRNSSPPEQLSGSLVSTSHLRQVRSQQHGELWWAEDNMVHSSFHLSCEPDPTQTPLPDLGSVVWRDTTNAGTKFLQDLKLKSSWETHGTFS